MKFRFRCFVAVRQYVTDDLLGASFHDVLSATKRRNRPKVASGGRESAIFPVFLPRNAKVSQKLRLVAGTKRPEQPLAELRRLL